MSQKFPARARRRNNPVTASPSDKGHFVFLTNKSPDYRYSTQIPFQIDSAASCKTLPSYHLSNMPWAKILPSRTLTLSYTSPPIKPIGQVTLEASKGHSAHNLTFQVITTDQPALLYIEASLTCLARHLSMLSDFVRKCSTSNTFPSLTIEYENNQEAAAGPLPSLA